MTGDKRGFIPHLFKNHNKRFRVLRIFGFVKKGEGFTIPELLVAMGIFIAVITVVSSVYVTSISSQRRGFGKQNVLDSSRFALESMARAIRQSSVSTASDGDALILEDHPDKGDIRYTESVGKIREQSGGQALTLTASNVVVESLNFSLRGLSSNDGEQPRVTIQMVVRSATGKASEQSTIRLQTTVTPRAVQIP